MLCDWRAVSKENIGEIRRVVGTICEDENWAAFDQTHGSSSHPIALFDASQAKGKTKRNQLITPDITLYRLHSLEA